MDALPINIGLVADEKIVLHRDRREVTIEAWQGLANTLGEIHAPHLVHNDIKDANTLVQSNQLELIDWGRSFTHNQPIFVPTFRLGGTYPPPEVWRLRYGLEHLYEQPASKFAAFNRIPSTTRLWPRLQDYYQKWLILTAHPQEFSPAQLCVIFVHSLSCHIQGKRPDRTI